MTDNDRVLSGDKKKISLSHMVYNIAGKSWFSWWRCFILFSIVFVSINYSDLIYWKRQKTPFFQDTNQYYSYLPAAFIHHAVLFNCPADYWPVATPNGKAVSKMTMGVAVLESPFFFIAHVIANIDGYPDDGYSAPYIWANYWGVILYVFVGLLLLYQSLILFFKPLTAFLSVFSVFYATNLLFYTISLGQMSHAFLFFLYSAFLFFLLRWDKTNKARFLYLLAFIAGLIAITRPPDMILFILFPLLGVYNRQTMRIRLASLISERKQLLVAAVIFLLTVSPQLIYWKINAGQFFFDTYAGERFYFSDPQIINFLFSYRKGLFAYSPIMMLAFIGFIPLYIKHRSLFWAVLLFTGINIFVLSSWYDWTYSASFGNRAIIQSYAILIVPLAAFFELVTGMFRKEWINAIATFLIGVVIYCCMSLNITMTKAYKNGLIHYSDMSKEAYWYLFNKEQLPPEKLGELYKLYKPLDIEAMKLGQKRDQ